ncbi:MAG: hypothetical protein LN412_08255 [Candidatus Thermoplasmatota archaeon]|nr:hypothetical protein [Candidatus Thermoplasmatota archaeon]
MTIWSWLSFAALVTASAPSVYFFLRMRGSNVPYAYLSLLLAVTLLVHSLFHLVDALGGGRLIVLSTETGSAALILAFALAYWPLRRRG